MPSTVAPIIHSFSIPVTGTSVAYPIPDVHYSHVMVVSNQPFWIVPGDSTVVASVMGLNCIYVPAQTLFEFPTRRMQVDGITHFAVIRGGNQNGFVNISLGHQVLVDTDLLMNIHSCAMHLLKIHQGTPQHPHYNLEQQTHIDVME